LPILLAAISLLASGCWLMQGTGSAAPDDDDASDTDTSDETPLDGPVGYVPMCWVVTLDGAEIEDMAAFEDGSSVVVGTFHASLTLGQGEPNETTLEVPADYETSIGVFAARFDTDGRLAWAKRLLGSLTGLAPIGIASTPDEGIVFATVNANVETGITLEPGEPDETVLDIEPDLLLVARYDEWGDLLWAIPVGAHDSSGRSVGLTVSELGSIAISGELDSDEVLVLDPQGPNEKTYGYEGDGKKWLYTAVLDENGAPLWAVASGGERWNGPGGAAFVGETLVMTGEYKTPITVGEGKPGEINLPDPTTYTRNAYVVGHGSEGAVEWTVDLHALTLNPYDPYSYSPYWSELTAPVIHGFPDGSSAIAGHMETGVAIVSGDQAITLYATPEYAPWSGDRPEDAFVAMLAHDGEVVWATATSSPASDLVFPSDITGMPGDGVAITGRIAGRAIFDTGHPGQTTVGGLTDDPAAESQYVAVYDDQGNVEWAAAALLGNFVPYDSYISHTHHVIAGLGDGNALLTGGFFPSAAFLLEDGTWQYVHSEGECTAFLAKVCP